MHLLPNYLRQSSRRNKTRISLLFFILLTVQPYLNAQETILTVTAEGKNLYIFLKLANYPEEKLLSSLREGFKAEIAFNIRLYRKSRGILRYFGDRMVYEAHPTYEAGWDIFHKQFFLTGDDGSSRMFKNKDKFLLAFFTLKNYPVELKETDPLEGYYILGSISLNTIKLVPPFNILSFLLPKNQKVTPWERIELSQLKPGGG